MTTAPSAQPGSGPAELPSGADRSRYLHAVLVNWGGTLLGIVASVVLSRWALLRLGSTALGSWYMLLQGVALLGLLDLGALALGPRDVATALGRGDAAEALAAARARRAQLLRQWPLALVGALAALWLLASRSPATALALATLLAAWVLVYPLRYGQIVLQARDDQAFLGGANLVCTLIGAGTAIAGMELGLGLSALALGWGTQQLLGAGVVLVRVGRVHGLEWLRGGTPAPPLLDSRGLMAAGTGLVWALFAGTDLLFVGAALGGSAAAQLGATGRLVGLAAILGNTMSQIGLPVLARAFGQGGSTALAHETVLLAYLCCGVTGVVLVVTAAANPVFVSLWLQPDLYAGDLVSLTQVCHGLVRQVLTVVMFGLIASGRERTSFLIYGLEALVFVIALPVLLARGGGVLSAPLLQLSTGLVSLVAMSWLFDRASAPEARATWRKGGLMLLTLLGWSIACAWVAAHARRVLGTGLPPATGAAAAGAVVYAGGAALLALTFPLTREVLTRLREWVRRRLPGGQVPSPED